MAEILVAFHRSMRTGQWQAHLAASSRIKKKKKKKKKKMLASFFAYDHRNYARLATCHFISVKRHSSLEIRPEICKEFMYVNKMFSSTAILICL